MALFHGTSSTRWDKIKEEGLLRRAPYGDQCVSLTDSREVADYFAANAAETDNAEPVILEVDATGLDTEPYSSPVWGEGECDCERETACWEDTPIVRVSCLVAQKA